MRILIALGGNALLRRGEEMNDENQRRNIAVACEAISRVGKEHQLIIGHGNGPQVGLLALQAEAYADNVAPWPFDVLGAETQGMIGYLLAQELGNQLEGRQIACVLTQVEVDRNDPSISDPEKFIGPVYSQSQACALREEHGWVFKADGEYYRRVVPSPQPQWIVETEILRLLVDKGVTVIAGGGGGIPVTRENGRSQGLEAVIDKDRCCCLLAQDLDVDLLIIATDVSNVFIGYGTPQSRAIRAANPYALLALHFPAGSMRPKIQACCEFALSTGRTAVIGSLADIVDLANGSAGTLISQDVEGIVYL
ncbi:MAG: carbamate kinase [Scandinavium sp.]|uniref:carbamate kinase n=1 Tax=Scandinavium sp. TaxID=2830653 RepID=UPI003F3B69BB